MDKTKICIFMSRPQIEGKNYNMKTANRLFENVATLKYFGTIVTCQNLIREGN
jgi:hypothetical protein